MNTFDLVIMVTGASNEDYVGLALGSAKNRYCSRLHQLNDDVLYGSKILDANCWFCGSVLDGKGCKAINCLWTKSIILDVDYGKHGHKRQSPFPDCQSAMDHVYSQTLQPHIIWHTGHGIQLAFLLDENISFSDAHKTALYEKHKRGLNKIFRGDSTCSREHLFRMPCSMNIKPGCPPVRGEILRWEVPQ